MNNVANHAYLGASVDPPGTGPKARPALHVQCSLNCDAHIVIDPPCALHLDVNLHAGLFRVLCKGRAGRLTWHIRSPFERHPPAVCAG